MYYFKSTLISVFLSVVADISKATMTDFQLGADLTSL